MDDDQQFCLRWNNHQSTLVAVFDTLLENGTLVDCTLAAEGKYLNAHKVVLSACSPYFEALLAQNYDKHPIFILKDVKFQELKAMMDYMYRGEVNISQDQLGALLKAAESLQIKGLSDNRKGETETRKSAPPPPPPAKSPTPAPSLPRVQGLTIEQRRTKDDDSAREGSQSPGPRKRKRVRRRSTDDLDNHHDASNSSESHHSNQTPAQNIPATLPAVSKIAADVPEPLETKSEILTRHKTSESEIPQVPIKEKLEATHTELMLEPKAEYVDEMNEDSIEDLTLDDDDISNMDQMDDGAGPSHGNAGEGSSQDVLEEDHPRTDVLLPKKSKKRYKKEYAVFKEWCTRNKIDQITENTLMMYFSEISKTVKPSSMWTRYSMIKAMLAIKDNINVRFPKLIAFLRNENAGYIANPVKTFTREEINKFLSQAPDLTYLMMKVVLIFGISGHCRCGELTQLKTDDVEDKESVFIVKIKDSETKHYRTFIVTNEIVNGCNILETCRKYIALRSNRTEHRRFFVKYCGGQCSAMPVGQKAVAKVAYKIAEYLHLPDLQSYNGRSFRKTGVLLSQAGRTDILSFQKCDVWQSSATNENYDDDDNDNNDDDVDPLETKFVPSPE